MPSKTKERERKKLRQEYLATQKQAAPPPRLMFAEDVDETLKDHLANCNDLHCPNQFVTHYRGIKLLAMVQSSKPKQLFLTSYSGTSHDYEPMFVLNLVDGAEIADILRDGCTTPDCSHKHDGTPLYLGPTCHNAGVDLFFNMKEPDTVTLVCADPSCRRPLRDGSFHGKLRLAPQPKAKYPRIFCSAHGIQLSYVACCHVVKGAMPRVLEHPTEKSSGLAMCGSECYQLMNQRVDEGVRHKGEFHSICQKSLMEILETAGAK